jgi:hypothetical protein
MRNSPTPNAWLLRNPLSSEPIESAWSSKPVICAADPGHRRKGSQRLETVTISNWPLEDFVWTWESDLLISERVLQVFAHNRVTGFETRPIEVVWPRPTTETPPRLFELVVTGWGGMASPKSGVRIVEHCPSCRHREYAVSDPNRIVDPATWDGSDFFMVWPLPRYRFVSDRLAQIIRGSRFSGVELIPATDIPAGRARSLTPGPLTDWMPERRALELAKKFDVL